MKETRRLIICRGIQGSGKSTYAKSWTSEDPEHRVRFNYDELRLMLGGGQRGYWIPSREKLLKPILLEFLNKSMEGGYDIIIDNMNLGKEDIEFFKRVVNGKLRSGNIPYTYTIETKDFYVPLEECIRRDSLRPNPISEKVIRGTYEKYKETIENDLYQGDYGK